MALPQYHFMTSSRSARFLGQFICRAGISAAELCDCIQVLDYPGIAPNVAKVVLLESYRTASP